jgi:hypothetical protein
MKSGDLVRIKKSDRVMIYLGLEDEMHCFWDKDHGLCELWKKKFNIKEKVELVKPNWVGNGLVAELKDHRPMGPLIPTEGSPMWCRPRDYRTEGNR